MSFPYQVTLLVFVLCIFCCVHLTTGYTPKDHDVPHRDHKSRGIAVLEINSETFNITHATVVVQSLLHAIEIYRFHSSFTFYACVHSSQDLIYDMSLQNFLYAHTLPIEKFFFSATAFGSLCGTELPSSLLEGAETLLQVSASLPPQDLTNYLSSTPSAADSATSTADMSLLHLPTSWVPGLRAHLGSLKLATAEIMPSRLDVAAQVIDWLQKQKQDMDKAPISVQTCRAGMEKSSSGCQDVLDDKDGARKGEGLPPPAASDAFHSSGPCHLWWPLNHSEIFLLASSRGSEESSGSGTQQLRENVIFTCPDLSPLVKEHFIVVMEGFQAANTASSPSLLAHPRVAKTREVVSLEGVDVELRTEALQLGALYKLPPRGDDNGLAKKWVRISICKSSIRVLSECVSRFTISRTIVYGDTWQPPVSKSQGANGEIGAHLQMPSLHPMSTQIHSRDVFGHALNMFGLSNGTFVEIGVNKGHFAKLMLEQWKGARYVMVDPWQAVSSSSYVDIANNPDQAVHEAVLLEALSSVSPHGSRPAILRNTSVGAAERLLDGTVDAVYIDALHHYHGVMQDIHAWWPKLRHGGVMAGHDFMLSSQGHTVFTVLPAVQEFSRHMNLLLLHTNDDYPTWFIFKP